MKLRNKYILFVGLTHLSLAILIVLSLKNYPLAFFICEFLLIVSLGFSIHLYKSFVHSLELIDTGVQLFKDRDFNTKLAKVGEPRIDNWIETYNLMMIELRDERIKFEEKHYFLERLIESSPSGIILLDANSKIKSLNPAAENIIGIKNELLLGRSLKELPEWISTGLESLQEGNASIIKNGIFSYKCQKSHFYDRGFYHHFFSIEELTKEILKTEKSAYEKVIRIMSHEINNSLGGINSILNSCLNYSDQLKDEDSEDYSNALNVAIERNTQLNKFMANFAKVVRVPVPTKENYDVHKILHSVHQLFKNNCESRNIIWEWDFKQETFPVWMDVQQITQVLLNIIKNSIEAIEENGKILISTNSESRELIIADTGKGIPKDLEQKIFTPFFSTKKDGQGIGLTLIREILLNHEFKFTLRSIPSSFTEFYIFFHS